jgi:rod shape-determining protein MreC
MVDTRGGRRFTLLFFAAAFLVLLLGRWIRPVDDVALSAAAPFAAAISGSATAVGDVVSGVVDGPRLRSENQSLKQQIGVLIRQNILLQQEERDNRILRQLLGFKDANSHLDLLPARVIASPPDSNLANFIIIDKGTRDGLRVGMTVVDQSGFFVGQVSQLASNASKVMLMLNPSSTVGAVDLKTGAAGVVDGKYAARPELDDVLTSATLHPGDLVVTSGERNLFPRNIPVGRVVGVHHTNVDLFQTAEVQPSADFQNLEIVAVVRNYLPAVPIRLIGNP